MVESFVLSQVVDGKEKKRAVFSRCELKELMQGLYYAKLKEQGGERRTSYGKIYSMLWKVLNGK